MEKNQKLKELFLDWIGRFYIEDGARIEMKVSESLVEDIPHTDHFEACVVHPVECGFIAWDKRGECLLMVSDSSVLRGVKGPTGIKGSLRFPFKDFPVGEHPVHITSHYIDPTTLCMWTNLGKAYMMWSPSFVSYGRNQLTEPIKRVPELDMNYHQGTQNLVKNKELQVERERARVMRERERIERELADQKAIQKELQQSLKGSISERERDLMKLESELQLLKS